MPFNTCYRWNQNLCKYKNKREDRHKKSVINGLVHICDFEPEHAQSKSILDYYSPIKGSDEDKIDFSETGLKQR